MSRTDLPVGRGTMALLMAGIGLAVTAGLLALPSVLGLLGFGHEPVSLGTLPGVLRLVLLIVCLTSLGGAVMTGLMIEHKRTRRRKP